MSRNSGLASLKVLTLALTASLVVPVGAQETGARGEQTGTSERDVKLSPVEVRAEDQAEESYINQEAVSGVGKTSIPIQDTPASITVVEQKFIEDTGAKNIEDALKYSSGVYAGQYGFDNRGDWAAVRGLSASKYVDGLRSLYGFYNSVRPNVYGLESIEVLKGPSSVLYGQAELGGIINAVSKLPKQEQQGQIWAQVGSYDRTQIAADVTGPVSDDGELLYRFVGLKRESGTQVDFVEHNGDVLAPSVTWKPNEGTELTLLVNYQKNEGAVGPQFLPQAGTLDPGPKGQIPPNTFVGEPGWDRYDREKKEVTLFLDQRLTDDWKLKATVRKTDTWAETREHWADVGATPDSDGNITRTIYMVDRFTDILNMDVRAEGFFDLGPTWHNLAVGVDRQDALWEEENYYYGAGQGGTINLYAPVYGVNFNPGVLNPTDRPDNEIEQLGVYVIDHIEIGKTVVSAALRRDDSESRTLNPGGTDVKSDDEETSGRLGLMYRFDSGVSPYVSYSEAFIPNLGTDGVTAAGLEPTTGEQKEAGVKYLSAEKDLSVDFAWFDIEETNRIQQGNKPGGVDQVGAVVEGWEIQVKKRWDRFELLANYTDLDAKNEQSGDRLSAIPEQQASLWGKYEFSNGIRAGLGGRYIGDRVGSGGAPEIPSVDLYDATLGYAINQWDFSVNVRNLTDEVYVSWCRYDGGDCGYGETRHVLANLRYNF